MRGAITSFVLAALIGLHPLLSAQTAPAQTKSSKTASDQVPRAYLIARNITTKIIVKLRTGEWHVLGSGVLLSRKGYVATCYHVVKDAPGTLEVAFGYEPFVNSASGIIISGSSTGYSAELAAFDQDSDVAILRVPREIKIGPLVTGLPSDIAQSTPQPQSASLISDLPVPGTGVVLAGYPLDGSNLLMQSGNSTGTGFPMDVRSSRGLRILISLVSNPGNSGGPVLNLDGGLLGLLEGNLMSPVRDEAHRQVLYLRPQRDAQGNPILGADGRPQFETAPLSENSGISIAIPTRFILDLARQEAIQLQ